MDLGLPWQHRSNDKLLANRTSINVNVFAFGILQRKLAPKVVNNTYQLQQDMDHAPRTFRRQWRVNVARMVTQNYNLAPYFSQCRNKSNTGTTATKMHGIYYIRYV